MHQLCTVESAGERYPDDMVLRDALQVHFHTYHFKDGGYTDRWFRVKVGPFYVPLPNIQARVRAVKVHDIHHVLTGYPADWKGEMEIAGWELASGCRSYWVAWLLNLGVFGLGLVMHPHALVHAMQRGWKARGNYYRPGPSYVDLLGRTVGDLRRRIGM